MPSPKDASSAGNDPVWPVSAQINLAPPDLPYCRLLLPRQIKSLSPHVSEIVLTLETQPGKGRFAESWDDNLAAIKRLIAEIAETYPNVVSRPVLYDDASRSAVQEKLGLPWTIPRHDFRGGPFFSYLFGLASTEHDTIFHLDSDMILGGDASGWFEIACQRLEKPDVAAVAPLAGPPTDDGSLVQDTSLREDRRAREYVLDTISTRIFLTKRATLKTLLEEPVRAPARGMASALLDGNPLAQLPEAIMTAAMQRCGLTRIDLAGPGLFYSLHPPYKSAKFLESLPHILEAVDTNEMPAAQRGHYDINGAFYDFSEERTRQRWWMRLGRRLS